MTETTSDDRTVHHETIVIDRRFAAAPARVFAAWATPEARARWAIPGTDWVIAGGDHDFRVGGHETSRFGPPGDPLYRAETTYLDIVPDRRIVMAGTMSDRDTPISASMATVELLANGGETRMIYTEQAAFLDGRDVPANRVQGWGQILDKLDAELRRDAQVADKVR